MIIIIIKDVPDHLSDLGDLDDSIFLPNVIVYFFIPDGVAIRFTCAQLFILQTK